MTTYVDPTYRSYKGYDLHRVSTYPYVEWVAELETDDDYDSSPIMSIGKVKKWVDARVAERAAEIVAAQ